jgi:two-component system nitrogen regulation response regulator GlnG/two-component system response regulator HydG
MVRDPIGPTNPGVATSLNTATQVPLLGFAILDYPAQPHRVGEFAALELYIERSFGRVGTADISKFGRFSRLSPGETLAKDPWHDVLIGDGISREHFTAEAGAVDIKVKTVGDCEMLVNGENVKSAVVKEGDRIMLEGALLLLCVRREVELPNPGGFIPAFGEPDAAGIIGESAACWRMRAELARLARGEHPVLITGESGSGKELAAYAIHLGSSRAKGPFVTRNLPNIPETLIAFELFGNMRNCPNPNTPARNGAIGEADHGTAFLDEIGECSRATQTALLRLLDKKEIEPIGASTPRTVDVRLVTATNRAVSELKHDLPPRLTARVVVPPLRERREDIPLLVRHWLLRQARETPEDARRFIYAGPSGRPEARVSAHLIDYLVRQPFPLNVRELHGLLLTAIHASPGNKVKMPPVPSVASVLVAPQGKAEIETALASAGGNIAKAARLLKLERNALMRRMDAFGITRKKDD